MGLILSIIFFAVAYISYTLNGKKITHTFIFAFLWAVIMMFEGLHLFGLYKSSKSTYLVIAAGVLAFSFGSLVFKNTVFKIKHDIGDSKYYINMKWMFIFLAATALMLLYPAIYNTKKLISNTTNLAEIRNSFSNIYSNKYIALLYNYIALPFSLGCLPIIAVMSFSDYSKKNINIMMLMTVIIIVERILVDAGRGILLYFFVMLFMAFKMQAYIDMPVKMRIKVKKMLTAVFLVIVVVYLLITLGRSGSMPSLFKQLYFYLCGCVPFLNVNLNIVNGQHLCLYGTGGLHGLYQLVFTLLDNVNIIHYPDFVQQADFWYNNALQARFIAPGHSFNAYATAFYNVYLDGGIISVLIEMFLYGALARCVYNKTILEPDNHRSKATYIFLLYGIAFSFIRYQFSLARNIIVFIFIILIIKKTGKQNENITS